MQGMSGNYMVISSTRYVRRRSLNSREPRTDNIVENGILDELENNENVDITTMREI